MGATWNLRSNLTSATYWLGDLDKLLNYCKPQFPVQTMWMWGVKCITSISSSWKLNETMLGKKLTYNQIQSRHLINDIYHGYCKILVTGLPPLVFARTSSICQEFWPEVLWYLLSSHRTLKPFVTGFQPPFPLVSSASPFSSSYVQTCGPRLRESTEAKQVTWASGLGMCKMTDHQYSAPRSHRSGGERNRLQSSQL